MGASDRRAGEAWARAQVLALVRSRVNVRFQLTADALADRIATLDVVAGARPEDLRNHVERLVLDDLYLTTACAAGEDGAWREVEHKHFAFIRSFAARFLRGAAAEDLAADVVADLWQRRKIAQFEGRSSLRTWLGAVVTRAALNAMAATRCLRVTIPPRPPPGSRTSCPNARGPRTVWRSRVSCARRLTAWTPNPNCCSCFTTSRA